MLKGLRDAVCRFEQPADDPLAAAAAQLEDTPAPEAADAVPLALPDEAGGVPELPATQLEDEVADESRRGRMLSALRDEVVAFLIEGRPRRHFGRRWHTAGTLAHTRTRLSIGSITSVPARRACTRAGGARGGFRARDARGTRDAPDTTGPRHSRKYGHSHMDTHNVTHTT